MTTLCITYAEVNNFKNINQLLQPFGAEILKEGLDDPKSVYRQKSYLQSLLSKTAFRDSRIIRFGVGW